MAETRPLYLISGNDDAKIDATRARLRARAESEGGDGALEVFGPQEGRTAPDQEALLAALPAMSLTGTRRYLLVDGVERWLDRQVEAVAAAIAELPPGLTLVLIARGDPPEALERAVRAAGAEVHRFAAPDARAMPGTLVKRAHEMGFRLDPQAAIALVERMGASPVRLANELERLALWAGEGGEVTAADLEEMVADTSEAIVWALADAIQRGEEGTALAVAERLISQGENVTGMVYALASRMRRSGREDLHQATEALADLEVWTRGGADYGDELAFTLAVRRASAAE